MALIPYKGVSILVAQGKYMLHEQYISVTMRAVISSVLDRLIKLEILLMWA